MMVKEYMQESTHIRIFDDYYSTENTEDNKEEIKNIIVSLLLKKLNNNRIKHLKQQELRVIITHELIDNNKWERGNFE